MKEEIKKKLNEFENLKVTSLSELEIVKNNYLGKKGILNEFLSKFKELSNEEKKEYGALINEFKTKVSSKIDDTKSKLEEEIRNAKLESEKVDVTLPGDYYKIGRPGILEHVIDELEELFISLGFDIMEGPEIEKDLYNFEMLNLPKGHPARDAQDTFYITEETLLRSQTSPAQIRAMLANKDKTPIRMVCAGKTYRRDNDDSTHSHQFTQMEGLVIDKNISLTDLKGTLDIVVKKLYGENVESRFRPSFYPFTEPSVELDITCFNCNKKGCPLCKGTGYITVGGAGMVHPNVLRNCGYDPKKYTGYALGMGIERLSMIKYGINDIRVFYTNDLRVNSFDKREE
jgi:phenylalanyl-tRNA synthetase alpha chain